MQHLHPSCHSSNCCFFPFKQHVQQLADDQRFAEVGGFGFHFLCSFLKVTPVVWEEGNPGGGIMCLSMLNATDCRNTYHSSSVIVIDLRFHQSHVGNTIRNTLQCIDYPSRSKLKEDDADDFKLHFFLKVFSVSEASKKMPQAHSQLCLVRARFSGVQHWHLFIVLNTSKRQMNFLVYRQGVECSQSSFLSACLKRIILVLITHRPKKKNGENAHL